MAREWTIRTLQDLLDETEDQERFNQTKYLQMVNLLAPMDLLQRVDRLVEQTPGLTRRAVLIRALHVYLLIRDWASQPTGTMPADVCLSQGGAECAG
jgi:hypothetical protein